jgi:phosphoglycerol transferase
LEQTGRWTDGATARLRFTRPLPPHFTLDLDIVEAYGPNRNVPSTVRIADQEREFTPAKDSRPLRLEFDLRRPADTIEIVIPNPTSPQSIGEGGDPRMLGVRLKSLHVTPRQRQ